VACAEMTQVIMAQMEKLSKKVGKLSQKQAPKPKYNLKPYLKLKL